jgi:hypothetical protein
LKKYKCEKQNDTLQDFTRDALQNARVNQREWVLLIASMGKYDGMVSKTNIHTLHLFINPRAEIFYFNVF